MSNAKIYLFFSIFLIVVGCRDNDPVPVYQRWIPPTPIKDSFVAGVFQNVTYVEQDDKYYLDTWVCTNERQQISHQTTPHDVLAKGIGSWATVPSRGIVTDADGYIVTEYSKPKPVYDSIISGSFNYIKSIKVAQYKHAKRIFDTQAEIETENKRIADSAAAVHTLKRDSANILNDIKY